MSCDQHPNYKGLRLTKNAKKCEGCVEFYNENKKAGIKGSRNRGQKIIDNVSENKIKECEPDTFVKKIEEQENDESQNFVIDDLTFNDVLEQLGIEEGDDEEEEEE